jgi:hypothetical protein
MAEKDNTEALLWLLPAVRKESLQNEVTRTWDTIIYIKHLY